MNGLRFGYVLKLRQPARLKPPVSCTMGVDHSCDIRSKLQCSSPCSESGWKTETVRYADFIGPRVYLMTMM